MGHVLAIDQGTTSSRAILFDERLRLVASAQEEFPQHFPQSGWVEHDPADLWSSTAAVCRAAIERAGLGPGDIAAVGITNQRETTLVWERATGRPLGRAIVWQDRRTAGLCAELRAAGHEPMITARTGLLLDPYFSGTKLKWLLDAHPGARERARRGELLFGTVDILADLEADRRPRARHRRDQRRPDAALQHPRQRLGPRDLRAARRAARDAADGARLGRRLRPDPRRPLRPRDPDPRRRRRPAGGDGRPGLLPAGHAEVDLRHRLLRGAEHRRRRRSRAATGC